jgi:hypothetical protein
VDVVRVPRRGLSGGGRGEVRVARVGSKLRCLAVG